MTKACIEKKLNSLLEDNGIYDSNSIVQTSLLEDMDSLKFIEFVVSIENEFQIGIPDEFLLLQYFQSKENILDIIYKVVNDSVNIEIS